MFEIHAFGFAHDHISFPILIPFFSKYTNFYLNAMKEYKINRKKTALGIKIESSK